VKAALSNSLHSPRLTSLRLAKTKAPSRMLHWARPTSAEEKKKVRLNALKNGFFSKDIVVTAAGERDEDYESFKAAVWDSVQPDDALLEILTDDPVVNWWRRQRVRRSESTELNNCLGNLKTMIHISFLMREAFPSF
jgi:hypothetical protein